MFLRVNMMPLLYYECKYKKDFLYKQIGRLQRINQILKKGWAD